MSSAEVTAIELLKRWGFEKIQRPIPPPEAGSMLYDYNAVKKGVKYAIEVKGTKEGRRFIVPSGELREMAWRYWKGERRGLLMFIDEKYDEWYVFEISRVKIDLVEYPSERRQKNAP